MLPEPRVGGNMFGREDAIMSHECLSPPLGCGRSIPSEEFDDWDLLSVKEYKQSGWCKECQDRVFRDPEECTCDYGPCCSVDVGVGVIYCYHPQPPCPIHSKDEVPPDYDDWMGVNGDE